jgi:hypothetical protein
MEREKKMTGLDGGSNPLEAVDIVWVGRSDSDPYWNRCHREFAVRDFATVYDAVADLLTGLNARTLVLNAGSVWRELKTVVQSLLSQGIVQVIFVYSPVKTLLMVSTSFLNGDLRVRVVEDDCRLLELLRENLASASVVELETEKPAAVESGEIEEEAAIEEISSQVTTVEAEAKKVSPEESFDEVWPIKPPRREPPPFENPPKKNVSHKLDILITDAAEEVFEPQAMELPTGGEDMPTADAVKMIPDGLPDKDFKLVQLTTEELDALLGGDFEMDGKQP